MIRWKGLPPILRFLVIGACNTLFGYGVYAFLVWIGLHYAVASLLATIAGVTFNFFTTGRLVFDRILRARMALRYVMVYIVVCALNVGSLALLASIGVGPYVGGIALILPIAVVAFVLMRRFVFGVVHGPD